MLRMYIASLMRREDGATMVEYGLMVALIAVIAMAGATLLGVSVNGVFTSISCAVSGAAAC